MELGSEDEADTTAVRFTVGNARRVESKSVFALVDVAIEIAGVELSILGVQARREPDEKTSVRLPTFKDANGSWQPAIQLPEEVRGPLADAVLTFLMEEGLARRKFVPRVAGLVGA